MNVSELQLGAVILFGHHPDDVKDPFAWMKVSNDNKFMLIVNQYYSLYDPSEYDSERQEFRDFGCSFWPHSCLRQELNASLMSGWFIPSHPGDRASSDKPGFLTGFDGGEIRAMVPIETMSHTPRGMVKQYGKSVTCQDLVTLPSAYQIFSYYDGFVEDEQFEIEKDVLRQKFDGYTRTSSCTDAHNVIVRHWSGMDTRHANRSASVCPVIKLAPGTPVDEAVPYKIHGNNYETSCFPVSFMQVDPVSYMSMLF